MVSFSTSFLVAVIAWMLYQILSPLPFPLHPLEPLPAAVKAQYVASKSVEKLLSARVEDILFTKDGTRVLAGVLGGGLMDIDVEKRQSHLIDGRTAWFVSGKESPIEDGRIFYCVADVGVVSFVLGKNDSVPRDVRIEAATSSDGRPVVLANQLDISQDGQHVYFSDSFSRFVAKQSIFKSLVESLFSGEKTGRLLVLDRSTGRVDTLMDGLRFANGVAVSPSQDFVVVAEMMSARLWRYWVRGPKKGTKEIWGPRSLPGYPDNLASDGTYVYVTLGILRNTVLDTIFTSRAARWIVNKLPEQEFGKDEGGFMRIEWATGRADPVVFMVPGLGAPTSVIPRPNGEIYVVSYFGEGYIAKMTEIPIAAWIVEDNYGNFKNE